MELRFMLPQIFMVDVEYEPFRLRYRLVGTELNNIIGMEMRGKYLDEMPFLFRQFASGAYEEILKTRQPVFKEVKGVAAYFIVAYQRLLLPLSDDDNQVNVVLGGIIRTGNPAGASQS